MAVFQFNAANVAPSTGNDPIPAGWYNAKITDSKIEPTSDGSGLRMNLMFEIMGGAHNGRKVFTGLNIKNDSAQAQEIAYKDLSAICHAVNRININQTEELHNIPLKIKVKVQGARKNPLTGEEYEARNEITTYKDTNAAVKLADDTPAAGGPIGGVAAPVGFAQPSAPSFAQAQQPAPVAAAAPSQPWAVAPTAQPWAGAAAAAPVAAPVAQTPPPGFGSFQQAAPVAAAPTSSLTPEVLQALATGQPVNLTPQQLMELQAQQTPQAQQAQAQQAQLQAQAQAVAQAQAAQAQALALQAQAAQAAQAAQTVAVQVPGQTTAQSPAAAPAQATIAIDPAIAGAVPPWAAPQAAQ